MEEARGLEVRGPEVRVDEAAPVRSTYATVDRGLVTLALVWQFLWIVGDSRLWPTHSGDAVSGGLLIGAACAWIALLIVHLLDVDRWRRPLQVADVALLQAAAIALLIVDSRQVPHDWSAASSIAVLPGAMAGLMFSTVVAATWVSVSVVVEAAIIFGAVTHVDPGTSQDLLYPAYALAVAAASIAARRALLRDAVAVDVTAADLVEAEEQRRVVEGVETRVRRQERLLHATVLNTLTAIIRGGLNTTELRDRLRERCWEAVQVMAQVRLLVDPSRATSSEGQDLDVDLRSSVVDLFAAGVVVHSQCERLTAVPPDVYEGIVTAAREALSNVLRHADAHTVWITARVVGSRRNSEVRVDVRDDGRGFQTEDAGQRFGTRSAVMQALADVGGSAQVLSKPGAGTTVEIRWSTSDASGVAPIAPYRPAARAFAYPILSAFGLFTALELILTREELLHPIRALFAFALYLGVCALVLAWSRRGPLPWWVVLVVAGVSPLIYQLQTQSVAADHGPWADWSSGAIVALFVVVAGAGPTWSWLALVATWLMIQGDVIHELMAPGTALIVAAALFGRSTRSGAAAIEKATRQMVEERAALAVSSASVRRMASRYGSLRESRVTELLGGIAEGRIDPDAEDARFAAAMEERFIRTVVKVDPAVDAVHALATSLAVRAHDCGVFLDVEIPESASEAARPPVQGRDSLLRAIECSERGGSARFSARQEGTVYAIRLITPISDQYRDDMTRLAIPGAVVEPAEPDMLWELRV